VARGLPPAAALATAAVLMGFVAPAARAEVGVSAAAASDYRFEGLSLSAGRPVLSASLAYDRKGGLYAGASALAVFARHDGLQPLGYVVYLGYSQRLSQDLSWDAGVANGGVSLSLDKRYLDDYTQIYVGLTKGNVSAHVYYSPSYFGESGGAVYVEVSGAVRPAPRWRLYGHAGLLTDLGDHGDPDQSQVHVDARAGLAREFKNFELRASVWAAVPTPIFPAGYRQPRQGVVVEAVAFF
jgi:uncharacterized protein (TIGR02001 family)